jgi:hypothetical protein
MMLEPLILEPLLPLLQEATYAFCQPWIATARDLRSIVAKPWFICRCIDALT